VLDAIAEIKARGLKVTLYPFVMMDVPVGNGLPDPYGAAEQAAYPWRGRITCAVAPGRPGTSDKTGAAVPEVDAFCGAATPGAFSAGEDTVLFSGDPDDWGYRRLILHYAALATAAGGVDAFLIGSELRGLTTLRDGTSGFPFVERLRALASDVRAVLGSSTAITYGADWSEYSGYRPADGSGDVFFHLDALWSHAAIDAVGIDNYMPLSDWRDADYAGGSPDGFRGPYDPDGLREQIAAGEGFDWFYASPADRLARRRTPVTDGAYGKPWTFRYKDLVGWWSNAHHDRPGGTEAVAATAWVPSGKPLWLTELGCPAVDKGPNQPNVFPDPKSSENASPYFSNGGRSDLAQQRFLSAHARHWDPADPEFQEASNPLSPVYGSRMVDAARVYLWSWDARPFPAFPLMRDVWSDGDNWSLGHWLNGRLCGISAGALIDAVLEDHGLPPADTSGVEGFLAGYVVADPSSARATLEPLVDLLGLSVREDEGSLVFFTEGRVGEPPVEITDMVVEGDAAILRRTRDPDGALPTAAMLSFQDGLREYQAMSAYARRVGSNADRERRLAIPAILDPGAADAFVSDWLRARWNGRERVVFSLPAAAAGPSPGAVLVVPDPDGGTEHVVTEIEEGVVRKVTARRILRTAPSPWRTALPDPQVSVGAVVGAPLVYFLDLPLVSDVAPESRFGVAAWARPWKTERVYASPEDSDFVQRAVIDRPAIVGELAEPIGVGFPGRMDGAATVSVGLSGGELQSVSRLRMLNGANSAAILAANGVWEVLQFQSAEEIAPSLWRLSGLLRGQLGTDDATATGAAAGAPFVLLDDSVVAAGLLNTEIGLPLNWRVGPSGADFGGPSFGLYAETGGLRALTPLSPVHLRAAWQANGDLMVTWVRRGRIDADSWLATEVPLGEEYEAYQVGFATEDGQTVRTATVNSPAVTYTAAQISADFDAPPEGLLITIRQVSAAIGPGIPATMTVPFS
jgi:hypothetical protein